MKPIETHFDGYHFRSRLEARWAVFFKTLRIVYEYEKEGYDLDGVWYLPDFWLPEQDCFVEIKGQEPTREEERKGSLLALNSGKDVHFCYNGVGLPENNGTLISSCDAFKIRIDAGDGKRHIARISNPLRLLLRQLRQLNVGIVLSEERGILCHTIEGLNMNPPEIFLQDALRRQKEAITALGILTQQYSQELTSLLHLFPGSRYLGLETEGDGGSMCNEWTACKKCKKVGITFRGRVNTIEDWPGLCDCSGDDLRDVDRLTAAYTAARSARFERGEK